MTGFGAGEVALAGGRVVAEIRSVNHRFLEVRARLPRELADLTLLAEQAAREHLRRGRYELGIRTEGSVLPSPGIDRARARAAFLALRDLRDELAPDAELPLALLAAVPDLFAPAIGPDLDAARDAVIRAIAAAITAMDRMRLAEGAALAADLRARAATLRELAAWIARRADASREGFRVRLRERLARLLGDVEVALDAGRLELEVAILADRSDVAEELTRLGSHLDQLEGLLAAETPRTAPGIQRPSAGSPGGGPGGGGEPVGRRLDFLLQEMVREVNTIGAKAQDAAASQHVVAMKVELERIREQVQNVE